MTTKGKNNNFDASEFVSPWIKKEELKAGPKTFTVEDVSETTFEARGDRQAQRVLVLELDGNRKYSLSTKADQGVMFGSDRVGGTRIRIPSDSEADRNTDIDDASPTPA